MKTLFLILLFSLIITNTSYCQDKHEHNNFHFGIKGGYNLSNVYDSEEGSLDAHSKIGIAAGFFAAIALSRAIGIHPEILISQRGFRATGILLGNPYELTRTTSYIDLPLLLALKPNRFITIVGGPQISYALKQKDEFVSSDNSVLQEQVFKNDNIRKNIMCLLAGADLNFHPAVIGFRTGIDLQKNNTDGSSVTPRYKNIWLQLSLGMRFSK